MEIFNQPAEVTAILPASDGSLYIANARSVWKFTPHTDQPLELLFLDTITIRRMEFVADPANDERYVQTTSGGNRFYGYDTTERYPPTQTYNGRTYPHHRAKQCVFAWSGFADGPVVYENSRKYKWRARDALAFCTRGNHRRRDGNSSGLHRNTFDWHRIDYTVRQPGSAKILCAGPFRQEGEPPFAKQSILARLFDAANGKFEGDGVLELGSADSWTQQLKTRVGTILVYTTTDKPWAREVMPDLTLREWPDWYPDVKSSVGENGPVLRADIREDRAAWVGLDNAVHVRTATNQTTRTFRPNGRRKVKGCAFSADGNTLWAFDSACLFRVDVDD